MADEYYVLTSDCDGCSIERLTKAQLLKRLDAGDWYPENDQGVWLDGIYDRIDLREAACRVIIKGKVVFPMSVETIIKHEVE